MTTDSKYPVILPKKGHVTELIIRHAHEKVAHGGRGMTLNAIRNRRCRKLRANRGQQKMADLPKE